MRNIITFFLRWVTVWGKATSANWYENFLTKYSRTVIFNCKNLPHSPQLIWPWEMARKSLNTNSSLTVHSSDKHCSWRFNLSCNITQGVSFFGSLKFDFWWPFYDFSSPDGDLQKSQEWNWALAFMQLLLTFQKKIGKGTSQFYFGG